MAILRRIWEVWKRIGRFIGDIIGRLFLTAFYFTVFLPFALIVRLFSDPLRIRVHRAETYWLDRVQGRPELRDARRQF
jgi:hypothetical protein